jgi:hypothetical protein
MQEPILLNIESNGTGLLTYAIYGISSVAGQNVNYYSADQGS